MVITVKLYLASKYQNRVLVDTISVMLEDEGHEVVSRWHSHPSDGKNHLENAQRDVEDIDKCDVFVLLPWDGNANDGVYTNESNAAGSPSAGRFVELGIALATEKSTVVFGEHNNIFDRTVDMFVHCPLDICSYPHMVISRLLAILEEL